MYHVPCVKALWHVLVLRCYAVPHKLMHGDSICSSILGVSVVFMYKYNQNKCNCRHTLIAIRCCAPHEAAHYSKQFHGRGA